MLHCRAFSFAKDSLSLALVRGDFYKFQEEDQNSCKSKDAFFLIVS